ncbi:YycC family protein [Neobacillus mesonae]|nr:YycC family protein [Neobacillus mesonae]
MRPLQISAETAVALSEKLGVPIEQLMHMPQHILMQKLAELAKEESSGAQEQTKPASDKDENS